MEHVYTLKLNPLLRTKASSSVPVPNGDKGVDDSLLDLVPQDLHRSLQLVDWSYCGLIACGVNVSNELSGGFGGGQVHQPVAAVFDCNEPQAVAILSAPEAASKRLQDSSIVEDDGSIKQTETQGGGNARSPSSGGDPSGWLMTTPAFYTHVSWHPHTSYLAAVQSDMTLDVWTNLPSEQLNDFDVLFTVTWPEFEQDCEFNRSRGTLDVVPIAVSWANCEFELKFQTVAKTEQPGPCTKPETVAENGPTLRVTKKLPLFTPSANEEESFSELNEACYNFCICIVTSNGFLLSVVFDSDGGFVNESCGILETCSSRKFKFSSQDNGEKSAGAKQKDCNLIRRALFHWDQNGRYITYLTTDGQIKVVKYQFQILDASFSCSDEQLLIEVEVLRTLDPKPFDITVEELVKSSLNVITIQAESNDKYINKQGKFPSGSQVSSKTKFDDETSEEEGVDSENKQKSKQIKLEKDEKEAGTVLSNVVNKRLLCFEYVSSRKSAEPKFDLSTLKVESGSSGESKMETDSQAATAGPKNQTIKSEDLNLKKDENETTGKVAFELRCFSEPVFPSATITSLKHLHDSFLHAIEEHHIIVYDSNAFVRVFDCAELKEILGGRDSKDTTGGRNRHFDGRFITSSPLGLAICLFNPGSLSVEVWLMPQTLLLSKAKPGHMESRTLESTALSIVKAALSANKDTWDLILVLKSKLMNTPEILKTFCTSLLSRSWADNCEYERALAFCALLTSRPLNETMGSIVSSFGFNLELKLIRIETFYRLMFKSLGKEKWNDLTSMINNGNVVSFDDSQQLAEFETFLLKESEFMLLLPIIQAVYDQVFLVLKLICERKHVYLINFANILQILKKLLFLQTLWINQSTVRVKHHPVFEKYVQSIDVKKFFTLICQVLSVVLAQSSSENQPPSDAGRQVYKEIVSFLKMFRPVSFEPKCLVSGVCYLYNRSGKHMVFSCDDINKPVRGYPSSHSESMIVDDVRFVKLGVRPVTDFKQCTRCGMRQGLRAKKQFRWPLWEALWQNICQCGGNWRRIVIHGGNSKKGTGPTMPGGSGNARGTNANGQIVTPQNESGSR